MSQTLSVRRFLGVKSATINLGGVTIIAGRNAAGKSSACTALGMILSRVPILAGMYKKDAGQLVYDGEEGAAIRVMNGDEKNHVTIQFPSCEIETGAQCDIQTIRPIFTGLADLMKMKDADRAAVLFDIIGASPTQKALAASLKEGGANEETVAAVWKMIETQGWDAAHTKAKTSGQKLKGKWEGITGQNFGSAKIKGYVPPGFVEGDTADDLEAKIAESELLLTACLESAGASKAEIARLEKIIAEREGTPTLAVAEQQLLDAKNKVADASTALSEIPTPNSSGGVLVECPECGAKSELVIQKIDLAQTLYSLAKPKKITKEALAAEKKKRSDAETALATAKAEMAKASDAVISAKMLETTRKELDGLRAKGAGAEGADENAASIRSTIMGFKARQSAMQIKAGADETAKAIGVNIAIVAALDPEGLRRTAFIDAIKAVNSEMAKMTADINGWEVTQFTPGLSLTYGGRPYDLLSESEKYRARASALFCLAALDKAAYLVFDGADILDSGGRNGLVTLAVNSEINVVIGMTIPKKELVPVISRSFWMQNGESEEIGTNG